MALGLTLPLDARVISLRYYPFLIIKYGKAER